jgi:Flp pilus assembly protein TadD
MPSWVNDEQRKFLQDTVRVDIVALRSGGTIDGELIGPLRPQIPALEPGKSYLVEVVIRTMKLGHVFTQGTADSNEVWLDVAASSGGRFIGRSGGLDPDTGEVDPWAHFVNAYVIDRDGNRIDRRNAEDIFTALYSHQIPPGAADSVHFVLHVPEDAGPDVTLEARLQYRKFDTTYMQQFQEDKFTYNDLPITTVGSDMVVLPVAGRGTSDTTQARDIPEWQRWNDYGIGLLRKGGQGQIRQAEEAFRHVEALGRPDGPLNLARACIKEGRLDEAVDALRRAADHDPPAYPWSVAYFTAVVNRQNGYLDEALEGFADIINTQFQEAHAREFDFSQDFTLLNEYAQTLFDRSKLERGADGRRDEYLHEAERWFQRVLELDSENAEAHYGLAQVYVRLGDSDRERAHRALYAKYKRDDNARDRAIVLARRKSAPANHAAEAIVLYDLQRPGAYELDNATARQVAAR